MIFYASCLARETQFSSTMTHLNAIETRQRKSASRDLLFAAFVALAAVISISTVTTAITAAASVAQR